MIDPSYVKKNFPPVRPDWLAQREENVIDPHLAIVDPHHHLWKLPEATYLRRELKGDLDSGHNVRATVFVDCHSQYRTDGPEALRPVGETEFVVAEIGGRDSGLAGACAAIVGWADLMLGDAVQGVLEQHVEAGKGRFRGIRTRAAWHDHPDIHPDGLARPGMLLAPKLQKGVRRLGAMGMTLDVWVYHTQLSEVARLAEACPDTTLIVDHCGGPLGVGPFDHLREEVFHAWREQIQALARYENIMIKLGGLAMPRTGFGLHELQTPAGSQQLAKLWSPYISTCIEAFGARRSMFESNFPVDKGGCSYRVLWNSFKRIAAECSTPEKLDLFARTAARIYRIEDLLHAS